MTRRIADAPCLKRQPARKTALEVRDDLEMGEWLRSKLVDCCGLDDDPWGVSLVERLTGRLNAVRAPAAPLEPVILWAADVQAFIGPGRYFYVTRGLLHRAWWEDAAALAIAHEMAHHDLGHTRRLARLGWARGVPGSAGALLFLIVAEHWMSGPERETEADLLGLELCIRAGFQGKRCLELFDVFTAHFLDHGDIDGVFGLASGLDEAASTGWRERAHQWLWQRRRGYFPLQERKEALQRYLELRAAAPEPSTLGDTASELREWRARNLTPGPSPTRRGVPYSHDVTGKAPLSS